MKPIKKMNMKEALSAYNYQEVRKKKMQATIPYRSRIEAVAYTNVVAKMDNLAHHIQELRKQNE